MRWIIRSSLRFRFLVVAAATALMIFGAGQLQNARTEAFPEFAPPRVEVQTITTGLSAEETEEFVTGPAGADAQRRARARPDSIHDGSPALLDRADLQQGNRSPAGAAGCARAPRGGDAHVADLGSAARDQAACLGGRPGHADRRHLERDVSAAALDDRLLEDQSPPAASARRRERGDLGRAPPAGARERRPAAHEGSERVSRRGHECHRRLPGRGVAALRGLRQRDRHRRLGRHPESEARDPARPAVRDASRPVEAAGQQPQRQGGAPGRRRGRGARPSASHRRRGRGTAVPASCSSWRSLPTRTR